MRCMVSGGGTAGVCCTKKLRCQLSESGKKGTAQDSTVQVLLETKVCEASNISKKKLELHAQQHHMELIAING